MAELSFLEAALPLTKTFTKNADGTIDKDPYPFVTNFTSHEHKITTINELFKLIKMHGAQGHCLIKGNLDRHLDNEPRKGHTRTDSATEWICLDFDRYPTDSVQTELDKFGVGNTSYIVQWSASHGMPGTEGTISCHVFMLLDTPVRAQELKLWLQHLNFKHCADAIKLTRNHAALSWPLDITTCQSDKLLYVTPPNFINMNDPLGGSRLELVKRPDPKLPSTKLGQESPEQVRQKIQTKKNELRRAIGLKATTAAIVFVGEHEVQNKPGEASVTSVKDCGDFIRLNLNGGDSFAYWHHKDNFELLFNFKGEPAYRVKELCPNYYADLMKDVVARNNAPSASGEKVLVFRDFKTAQYYNGTYNPNTAKLKLAVARSETQIEHFMMGHSLTYVPPIPVWDMDYDPRSDFIVDFDKKCINTFQPSEYMINATEKKINFENDCPNIYNVMLHMCGDNKKVLDEVVNWFACLFNRVGKPRTAWVFHGIEGTGKGTFFECIATPMLGPENVFYANVNTVEDRYNDWMMNKLLIFIDEVDYDDFKEKGRAAAIFRGAITDYSLTVRAMRVAPYKAINYFGVIFASNKKQPVYVPPSDRRYNVAYFQKKKVLMSDDIKAAIKEELEDFACYMHSLKADVARASEIYETPDRTRMQALAVTSLQETANAIIDGQLDILWDSMPDQKHLHEIGTMNEHMAFASAYATLIENIAKDVVLNKGALWHKLSRDEMRTIFHYCVGNTAPTPQKFTSLLRHCGIELKRMRRGDNLFQGFDVKKWHASDELLAELDRLFVQKTNKLRIAK